jgi:HAD superfamily hydrolase (TIGR01509 family)
MQSRALRYFRSLASEAADVGGTDSHDLEYELSRSDLPALIFDCDGVLIDSEWLASRVEAELVGALGDSLTTEQAHELFLGKTIDGVLEIVAARTGTRPSTGWVYNWAFATAHAFLTELVPIPGIVAGLEELTRRGHRMAVASQSPLARVQLSLAATQLAHFFGTNLFVTSMVARPKPAPDIYLLAANRLGAAPAQCVVIEDSPAGAAAALAAGMQVIGYAPGDAALAMQASGAHVITDMNHLLAALENLPARGTAA